MSIEFESSFEFVERAKSLDAMNGNVFTKESGTLDDEELAEWLKRNTVHFACKVGKVTVHSGEDQYGQAYWAATHARGLHFATLPTLPANCITTNTLSREEVETFLNAPDTVTAGVSDSFIGFEVIFGLTRTLADFLIIRSNEGQAFILQSEDVIQDWTVKP